jgi:crotonobetainyl-CoA:carnitine CoA-transferase CaiB-like acyl-CoA transferase
MSDPLADLRVLDLAGGVAAGYCSKLLADLGADVILVEPPQGDDCRRLGPFPDGADDPERSGLFLSLHASKRSIVADPASADDRDLVQRLAADADVVLTRHPSPWDVAAQPALIQITVSDFGATGPYKDWAGDEITDYAMGGYFYFGGDPEREPLLVPGYQAQHHAGMQAALAALAALAERDRSGCGQSVDVSAVEAMLSAHSWTSVAWSHEGLVLGRTPTDLVRCQDGWVFFMPTNIEGMSVLVERFDLLEDPRFSTVMARMQNRADLYAILGEWCAQHTMDEIYRRGQELRVAVTPVHGVRELAQSAQLAARSWFRDYVHPRAGAVRIPGAPYKLSAMPPAAPRPAPLLNEHGDAIRASGWGHEAAADTSATAAATTRTAAASARAGSDTRLSEGDADGGASRTPPGWLPLAQRLPLDGLRVIELTANWAGPLAGRYLADLGAEVIKIEAPKRPATRGSHYAGNDARTRGYNRSGYFNKLNRNKLGLALDLSLPEGRETFLQLVRRADVVIENNSARVLANLKLDYDVLRREQPGIILCSMSGFGATGPERDYVAYGSNIETICGLSSLMGYHDDPMPHRTGSYYADPVAATHGAIAVLAALRHRDRTGEGQFIDLSLLESAAALFDEALMDWSLNQRVPVPTGNRHPRHAPQGCYPSAGVDSWLALTVRDEREWAALCAVIGRADLCADSALQSAAGRRAAHDAIDEAIGDWSRGLDHYEAARALQAAGVPAAPVLANWELLTDPHLFARGFYVPVPHPEVGVLPFPGMPWHFSRTPGAVRAGAPCFAEHNHFIFSEILQLSDEQTAELYAHGITADEPQVQLIG